MSNPITAIQLAGCILGALAPSAILLWFIARGRVKKRHAVLAYRVLEERCRCLTKLAADTWPILEPLRGEAYTKVIGQIFQEAKELGEAVHKMLHKGGVFDPIEAVKYAAAREGELERIEECLAEMDHDHATSNFRTVTPANRVAELVGWLRNRPGKDHPNGPAFGRKDPNAPNIQYLARQLHDIVRALEDAEYPTDNPAQTILQLLNADRAVRPFPEGPLPSMANPPFTPDAIPILEARIGKLNAEFRRTVDVCAPFAINVTFVDSLAMYVRTVLEQVRANSYIEGGKAADERTLTETRGRKSKAVEVVTKAQEEGIIDSTQFHRMMAIAQALGRMDRSAPETRIETDGTAS